MFGAKLLSGLVTVGLVAGAGFGFFAFENYRLESKADEYKLNARQKLAFRACVSQTNGLKLTDWESNGRKNEPESVPLDVCACQSKHMAEVFPEGNYRGHGAIIAAMHGGAGITDIDAALLSTNWRTRPKAATTRLLASMKSCISAGRRKYASGN